MKKLAVILCLGLFLVSTVHAADNYLGTWTLNLAKSKYNPGPGPKSQTTRLEAAAGGLREVVDRVNGDNTITHWDLTAKFDGKDYPVVGDPDRDMVSVKRVDDNTLEVVNKKAGKVTTKMKIVTSKDGKSRTNEVSGNNAKGQPVNHLLYFDRK
jgi:hypothetical protein